MPLSYSASDLTTWQNFDYHFLTKIAMNGHFVVVVVVVTLELSVSIFQRVQ